MSSRDQYSRVAKAIEFILEHFQEQPKLEEVAAYINLSPLHFQKLFTQWVGTSPKKFLQYTTIQYAKEILKKGEKGAVLNATYDAGLSSTSRLHDLFVNIEAMTPSEYKNGGAHLYIDYDFTDTPFGRALIASTEKGICYMAFEDDIALGVSNLKAQFPHAIMQQKASPLQQDIAEIFSLKHHVSQIKLHLKGTDFQLKVWESLLKIPTGYLTTYGHIAQAINKPTACRAVGTAIGHNPVAFLIPCHRVIQSSGIVGGYKWGKSRKTALMGWEGSKIHECFQ